MRKTKIRASNDPRLLIYREPLSETPNEFHDIEVTFEAYEPMQTRTANPNFTAWRLAEKTVRVSFKAYYKEIADSIDPDSGVSYECNDVQIICSDTRLRYRKELKKACIDYVNNYIQEYEADSSEQEIKYFI